MAINAIQAAIRSMTGTERQFNGDLHAYWDQLGIPPGQFAERMVAWKQLPQNAAWIAATEDADALEGVDGLWRNGEQGVWYDASDLSTMFQDAAGTLPVYAPGQGQVDPPVGRILDKSGRGKHAYQTTATSRPTLSARYNLLNWTERLDIAPWSVLTSGAATIGRTSGYVSPRLGTNAVRLDFSAVASGEINLLRQIVTVPLGAPMRPSIWLRADAPTVVYLRRGDQSGYDALSVTTTWTQFFASVGNAASATHNFDISTKNSSANASSAVTLYAWGADLRVANDGVGLPAYQRIDDANTYDTTGFPLYLKFDGVDDWLQTASIDFSGSDKVFCAASFRKLSDATTGSLFELSATIASNPGSFYITAPGAGNSGNIKLAAKGTTEVNVATTAAGYPSPISAIASAVMDIAAPISTLRINGVVAQSSSASLGSGSLGNYPLYIGRRGGATLPFNGRIYGLLIRGAATSNSTINNVERYLNQKAKVF